MGSSGLQESVSKRRFLDSVACTLRFIQYKSLYILLDDYVKVRTHKVKYRLNKCYESKLLITADVIKPFIRLEKDHVTLKYDSRPNSSLKAHTNISLTNETNAFVDFNWNPIMDENGISFSMRPGNSLTYAKPTQKLHNKTFKNSSRCLDKLI